jgi:uncharacterized protein (DUF433 family)
MVSALTYKTIKKAVIIRLKRGEEFNDIIASYPKLSDKQKAQMLVELTEEGYISTEEPEDETE